jgi:hypothetical protein
VGLRRKQVHRRWNLMGKLDAALRLRAGWR